jgi:hypothetical protein
VESGPWATEMSLYYQFEILEEIGRTGLNRSERLGVYTSCFSVCIVGKIYIAFEYRSLAHKTAWLS